MDGVAAKVIYDYEYWFETTPRYKVASEDWELHDVFLKRLDTGAFVFVPVFRRKMGESNFGKYPPNRYSKEYDTHF